MVIAINGGELIYIEMDGFCTTFESQNLDISSNASMLTNCTNVWWPLLIIVLGSGIVWYH
jgi:hypothetical protein